LNRDKERPLYSSQLNLPFPGQAKNSSRMVKSIQNGTKCTNLGLGEGVEKRTTQVIIELFSFLKITQGKK
jgi:hypothetical protein